MSCVAILSVLFSPLIYDLEKSEVVPFTQAQWIGQIWEENGLIKYQMMIGYYLHGFMLSLLMITISLALKISLHTGSWKQRKKRKEMTITDRIFQKCGRTVCSHFITAGRVLGSGEGEMKCRNM